MWELRRPSYRRWGRADAQLSGSERRPGMGLRGERHALQRPLFTWGANDKCRGQCHCRVYCVVEGQTSEEFKEKCRLLCANLYLWAPWAPELCRPADRTGEGAAWSVQGDISGSMKRVDDRRQTCCLPAPARQEATETCIASRGGGGNRDAHAWAGTNTPARPHPRRSCLETPAPRDGFSLLRVFLLSLAFSISHEIFIDDF